MLTCCWFPSIGCPKCKYQTRSSGKVSAASINRAGDVLGPQQGFYGVVLPKYIFSSKEHLDWLKLDFNVIDIIAVYIIYKATTKKS